MRILKKITLESKSIKFIALCLVFTNYLNSRKEDAPSSTPANRVLKLILRDWKPLNLLLQRNNFQFEFLGRYYNSQIKFVCCSFETTEYLYFFYVTSSTAQRIPMSGGGSLTGSTGLTRKDGGGKPDNGVEGSDGKEPGGGRRILDLPGRGGVWPGAEGEEGGAVPGRAEAGGGNPNSGVEGRDGNEPGGGRMSLDLPGRGGVWPGGVEGGAVPGREGAGPGAADGVRWPLAGGEVPEAVGLRAEVLFPCFSLITCTECDSELVGNPYLIEN